MKAIILAAGYATRLYPLTEHKAKPLLEIGGKPIIDYIFDRIRPIDEIEDVFVVTNELFYLDFLAWSYSKQDSRLKVINDGTRMDQERLGSIGDIYHVIVQEKISEEDLLVIAGDNLFGFNLKDYVAFFKKKKSSLVALYDLKYLDKVKGKFGVAVLLEDKVIDFQEKPLEPKSALTSTACYIFHKKDVDHIRELIEQGTTDPLGLILQKLVKESELNGFVFTEPWFDIGSLESLEEARKYYGVAITGGC
ncbi:MAG TPA: nucleotidyltransferase family protein [Candidatus Nanoarchaeia archaeon]|nr:nucleotidyltransferase family protein [Candidatus Nanoarchaeia archaeon]